MHDKNKLAHIFKIFVPLFSRDCGNFHSTKFVLLFGMISEYRLGAIFDGARLLHFGAKLGVKVA